MQYFKEKLFQKDLCIIAQHFRKSLCQKTLVSEPKLYCWCQKDELGRMIMEENTIFMFTTILEDQTKI